ncbi:MAG: MaoC family dehydratase [Acidimicrobiia bacterium]
MTRPVDDLRRLVGREVGMGDWLEVTQERIDRFADATDDHQWVHVDPEAAAAGPFGSIIAHGYLTLSLLPRLTQGLEPSMGDVKMTINYGLDRLRFVTPVPAGGRIRARVTLTEVTEVQGGAQVRRLVTVELEGSEKPACVVEVLTRYLW